MQRLQSKELKHFLTSFGAVVLLIIVADFVIGVALKKMYQKQKSGLLYRTSYCIDSTRADYLVFGSSRANHHYDPRVFESDLGDSFYNCGRDAQGCIYSCALISAIVDRYSPKCIIIDIRPDEFTQSDAGTLSSLFPYYQNKSIRPYLRYEGRFQNIKMLSRIYPYNSLFTNLFVGMKVDRMDDFQGYVPLYAVNSDPALASVDEVKKCDSGKVQAFYDLLHKLHEKGIKTFLIISPTHANCHNPVTVGICAEAASRFSGIYFLNYVNDPQWQNNDLFSDDNHLNAKGATLFSHTVAKLIKE